MTAAHRAVLHQLLRYLRSAPDVVIRFGTVDAAYGEVEFATRVITLDEDLDDPDAIVTLAHELVHLERGPGLVGDEDAEEAAVVEETARLLVPPGALPAILEAANPARIAAALEIDEPTVQLAIDLTRRDHQHARSAGGAA